MACGSRSRSGAPTNPKGLDDQHFLQRFTPRRARSIWSKINVEKVAALIEAGHMQPPGLAQVEAAKADTRWAKAYDGARSSTVPEDLQAALEAEPKAKAFFATVNASTAGAARLARPAPDIQAGSVTLLEPASPPPVGRGYGACETATRAPPVSGATFTADLSHAPPGSVHATQRLVGQGHGQKLTGPAVLPGAQDKDLACGPAGA